MPPQTFVVRVLRPEDLLELLFHFVNVGFTAPLGSTPGQIVGQVGSYLVVYFQPQHIAEEAFLKRPKASPIPLIPTLSFPRRRAACAPFCLVRAAWCFVCPLAPPSTIR